MKKFRNIIIILLGVVIVLMIAFAIYRHTLSVTPPSAEEKEAEIKYFTEENDVSILIYGENVGLSDDYNYEMITSLDDESWQKDSDYVFLFINDMEGTADFSESQLKSLLKYADLNTNFNFYYLGTDKLKMIEENVEDCNFSNDEKSFGYVVENGSRMVSYGLWGTTEEKYKDINSDILQESIITEMKRVIGTSE